MPYLKRIKPVPEPLDCRILTAALDLFVNHGFHNVSVHEIQKQADVSIGSIYKHFGGKEGIAKALYKHILNEVDVLIDLVVKDLDSPSAQCKEIIKQLFEHTETHPNIIAFVFHSKHTEYLSTQPSICSATPFKRIRDIIVQGIAEGELRDMEPIVATSTILGSAIRMIQLRLDGNLEQPLPDYYDSIIDASWNGVLTTEPKGHFDDGKIIIASAN